MIIPTGSNYAVTGPKANSSSEEKNGLSGINGDQFMQILLAQLRHQNPLEPMNDKDMMAQMTQLNSLTELQKINDSLEKLIEIETAGETTGTDETSGSTEG